MMNTLIDKLLQRPIAFHRIFAEVGGGATEGLFLSQAYYWSFRTKNDEGWFYKSAEEWYSETMLVRRELESARKTLKRLGILEEEKRGIPCRLYYRLNRDKLYLLMLELSQICLSDCTNKFVQNDKLECTNEQTSLDDPPNILYPENTSETSSKDYIQKSGCENFEKASEFFLEQEELPEQKKEVDKYLSTPPLIKEDPQPPREIIPEDQPSRSFDYLEQSKYKEIEDLESLPLLPSGKKQLPWENQGRSLNHKYDEAFAAWLYENQLKRYTGFTKEGYPQNKNMVRGYLLKAHSDVTRLEKIVDAWNEFISLVVSPPPVQEAPEKPLESFLTHMPNKLRQIILQGNYAPAQLTQLAEIYEACDRKEDLTIMQLKRSGLL